MREITIGRTVSGDRVALPLLFANRHGLVTGVTGSGKTVTLQRLAEEFSRAGVPVFAADVKGDLSGIAALGDPARFDVAADKFPVAFWDIFGEHGLPIKTSVHAMGDLLLSSMLHLNETQAGAMAIAFRKLKDEQDYLLTLDDARWTLNDMLEDRETVCAQYGHITAASISATQRAILALEAQGGANLFGEPAFAISDLLRVEDGRGVVNLLHADQLIAAPKVYAVFLLWLLTELFKALPEVGDIEKPKLVFFFDEAHLLFADAPKPLLAQIERLVRLVRSKGVGVYFVTQSPMDVPDNVLGQLGTRIQHALRAYTPAQQRMVKAASNAFRPNPNINVKDALTSLAVGEALVSVIESEGVPSVTERVRISAPAAQVGPISIKQRRELIAHSPLDTKYGERLDDQDQNRRFIDRMRAEKGLGPIEWSGEEWKPGDYAKFTPDFTPKSELRSRAKSHNLWLSLGGLTVAAICFWQVGLL
jgi:DNA helicase HerA-like ATPase